jgi:hypothetical protein
MTPLQLGLDNLTLSLLIDLLMVAASMVVETLWTCLPKVAQIPVNRPNLYS